MYLNKLIHFNIGIGNALFVDFSKHLPNYSRSTIEYLFFSSLSLSLLFFRSFTKPLTKTTNIQMKTKIGMHFSLCCIWTQVRFFFSKNQNKPISPRDWTRKCIWCEYWTFNENWQIFRHFERIPKFQQYAHKMCVHKLHNQITSLVNWAILIGLKTVSASNSIEYLEKTRNNVLVNANWR